ncbi:MAG: hypothetical protein R3C49_19765 [Planctomycetaceae bacterium]
MSADATQIALRNCCDLIQEIIRRLTATRRPEWWERIHQLSHQFEESLHTAGLQRELGPAFLIFRPCIDFIHGFPPWAEGFRERLNRHRNACKLLGTTKGKDRNTDKEFLWSVVLLTADPRSHGYCSTTCQSSNGNELWRNPSAKTDALDAARDWEDHLERSVRNLSETNDSNSPSRPKASSRTEPTTVRRKNKTKGDVDDWVDTVINSGNQEELEFLLTSNAENLAQRIGCNRKTVMNSRWWREDRKEQRQRYFAETTVVRPKKSET